MTRRLFLIIIITIWMIGLVLGQDSLIFKKYRLHYGTPPNIESGVRSVLDVSSFLFDQVNLTVEKIKQPVGRGFARIGNFLIVQIYAGGILYGTVLHEYFGHSARARKFDVDMDLRFNFPGLGGDDVFLVNQSFPAIQRQLIVSGGPEATGLLAHEAVKKLYSDEYTGSYIGNYLLAGKLLDGIAYIQDEIKPFLEDPNGYYADNASYFRRNPVPNDPLSYALALTERYGYYDNLLDPDVTWFEQQPNMTVYTDNDFIRDQHDRLKRAFLLAAFDPAILYFIYGNYLYLAKGQRFFKPFMFNVGGYSIMPSVRAVYGEIGAENFFDLFVRTRSGLPFNFYYRSGGNLIDKLHGFGGEVRQLTWGRLSLTAQFDYWNNQRDKSNNINLYSSVDYQLPSERWFLNAALGYKSKGFLPGKSFDRGIYFYGGLAWSFIYD